MGIENNQVVLKYQELITNIGKNLVHSQFPKDFELYICVLELVNSQRQIVDYFIFPVMPSSISEDDKYLVSIKKTAGGIVSICSDTFTPREIKLHGNFGRRFKILIGNKNVTGMALKYSTQNGVYTKESVRSGGLQTKQAVFDTDVKTGYGCIKILEAIFDKSRSLDIDGNPFQLYFYNLALGNHYLVKITSLSLSQDLGSNMIWNYQMSMEALAPLESIIDDNSTSNSLTKSIQYDTLDRSINMTVQSLISATAGANDI